MSPGFVVCEAWLLCAAAGPRLQWFVCGGVLCYLCVPAGLIARWTRGQASALRGADLGPNPDFPVRLFPGQSSDLKLWYSSGCPVRCLVL